MAVDLARGAAKFAESIDSKKKLYAAAFARTKEQSSRAMALLKIVMWWKGTEVFTSAGTTNSYQALSVLECFNQSLASTNREAHCFVTYRHRSPDQNYLIPCRYLDGWIHAVVSDQKEHPANLPSRIQALAVRKGCSWCPHFMPERAQQLQPFSFAKKDLHDI